MISTIFAVKNLIKKSKENEFYDVAVDGFAQCLYVFTANLISIMIVAFTLNGMLTAFFNPNYYVVHMILQQLQR